MLAEVSVIFYLIYHHIQNCIADLQLGLNERKNLFAVVRIYPYATL